MAKLANLTNLALTLPTLPSLSCDFFIHAFGHKEDELVTDEFGGSVVRVGTNKTGMRFRSNGKRGSVRIQFVRRHDYYGRNGRRFLLRGIARRAGPKGGEDEGDAFDMDGNAEDDGVEVFAEHSDEGRI